MVKETSTDSAKGIQMRDLARQDDHNEIALAAPGHADRIRDWVELFRDIYKVAEALSRTAFVPAGLTGKPEDVAACMMKGFELGMDPLDSLASMYVVHGKVGVTAEFMRRRILQAGHSFKIVESTDSRAIVEACRREGGEPHRATFTADQARKAGIDIGKYPADKLIARATSRLCRQSFPDVLSGSLLVEDLMDGYVQDAGMEAPPPAVRRKRATPRPVASDTQPAPPLTAAAVPDAEDDLLDDPASDPERAERQQVGLPESGAQDDPETLGIGEVEKTWDQTHPPTVKQNKMMFALFNKLGLSNREDRLEVVADIIGYRIDSSASMSRNEAANVISTLTKWWEGDNGVDPHDRINDILNEAAIRADQEGEVS